MRQTDKPEEQPSLPPPIRKPAAEPEPERWEPMSSRPGYERNQSGSVRKKPPQSIYELYGVSIFRSTGEWTKPAECKTVVVRVVGAGSC